LIPEEGSLVFPGHKRDPEEAIAGVEPRDLRGAIHDGELVAQGQVLQHQVAARAEEREIEMRIALMRPNMAPREVPGKVQKSRHGERMEFLEATGLELVLGH
jgi:hypothetical protein